MYIVYKLKICTCTIGIEICTCTIGIETSIKDNTSVFWDLYVFGMKHKEMIDKNMHFSVFKLLANKSHIDKHYTSNFHKPFDITFNGIELCFYLVFTSPFYWYICVFSQPWMCQQLFDCNSFERVYLQHPWYQSLTLFSQPWWVFILSTL